LKQRSNRIREILDMLNINMHFPSKMLTVYPYIVQRILSILNDKIGIFLDLNPFKRNNNIMFYKIRSQLAAISDMINENSTTVFLISYGKYHRT
jgi:hypothetical protein